MKNKKIVFLSLGILLLVGIIVGTSYAWWSHVESQEGINSIQSTCLEIKLIDENPITIENGYPITDAEARLLTPYKFTIQNKCNTAVEYDVNLDIMESKDGSGVSNRLSSEYVAIEFNGGEKKLLNTLTEVETSYPKNDYTPVEGRYLTSGKLDANESVSYTIKLWMDESVEVEDNAMNKNFISKVVVTAQQSHIVRLVDYIINDNVIEEFSHEATEQTPALTDYRYTGKNPSNYVCFGSEEVTCPEDNLYRIIGVMPTQSTVGGEYENRVKLIKANYYTENKSGYLKTNLEGHPYAPGGKGYYWNIEKATDKWEEATLQENVLNGVYWDALGEYQKYIEPAKWYLGGSSWNFKDTYTSEQFYKNERSNDNGKSGGSVFYVTNIGVMYPSDYGYSINQSFHKESINSHYENYISNSWLYNLKNNEVEHLISVEKDYPDAYTRSFTIDASCGIGGAMITNDSNIFGVRPTFYLKANVLYESGSGTKEDPYRISINE